MQPLFTFHQLDTKTLAFFRQNQLVIHLKSVQQLLYLLEKLMKRHCQDTFSSSLSILYFVIFPLFQDYLQTVNSPAKTEITLQIDG